MKNFKKLPKLTNEEKKKLYEHANSVPSSPVGSPSSPESYDSFSRSPQPIPTSSIPNTQTSNFQKSKILSLNSNGIPNYIDLDNDVPNTIIFISPNTSMLLSKNNITFIEITNNNDNPFKVFNKTFEFPSTPSSICRINPQVYYVCFSDGTISELRINNPQSYETSEITINDSIPSDVSNPMGNYFSIPNHYICGDNIICKTGELGTEYILQSNINFNTSIFVDIFISGNVIFVLDTINECIWAITSNIPNPQKIEMNNITLSNPFGMCQMNMFGFNNIISILIADSGNQRIVKLNIEYDIITKKFISNHNEIILDNIDGHPTNITNENGNIISTIISPEHFKNLKQSIVPLSKQIEPSDADFMLDFLQDYTSLDPKSQDEEVFYKAFEPNNSFTHYSLLKSMYYFVINYQGRFDHRIELLGFIIGCCRNLIDCPVPTNIQSIRPGDIISWENTITNTTHFGISIDKFEGLTIEICNTLGNQYVAFDTKYSYEKNEILFVIENKSTPRSASIIKQNEITNENKSRIIGKLNTEKGFISSKSELPEYIQSSWCPEDIYGIVHMFGNVSLMRYILKSNYESIIKGDFIKYIDSELLNFIVKLYFPSSYPLVNQIQLYQEQNRELTTQNKELEYCKETKDQKIKELEKEIEKLKIQNEVLENENKELQEKEEIEGITNQPHSKLASPGIVFGEGKTFEDWYQSGDVASAAGSDNC